MSHLTARVYIKQQAYLRNKRGEVLGFLQQQFRNLSEFYRNQFDFLLQDIAEDNIQSSLEWAVAEMSKMSRWVWSGQFTTKVVKKTYLQWNVDINSTIDDENFLHQIRIEFVAKPATQLDAKLQSLILLTEYQNQLLQTLISQSVDQAQISNQPELPEVGKKPKKEK